MTRDRDALREAYSALAAAVLREYVDDYRVLARRKGRSAVARRYHMTRWLRSRQAGLFLDVLGVTPEAFRKRLEMERRE